jgi:beta-mannosidase
MLPGGSMPLCCSPLRMIVTSDLTEPWGGVVQWSLETLAGEVILAGQEAASAAPLSSTPVCDLDFGEVVSDENRRHIVFVCELLQGDQRVALNMATFLPDKHLALADPGLTVAVELNDDRLSFEVTGRTLARHVELALDGVDVVFSDNYFDVPAGRTVTVTCSVPEGWTLGQARQALRVRSLYDSFA